MQYLTYDEYTALGGTLDLTAFTRVIDRACGIIDNATFGRLEEENNSRPVMCLCRDLCEYLYQNDMQNAGVSSRSQSAGSVSESVTYANKSREDMQSEIDNMIYDYLAEVKDSHGRSVLYRG